MKITIYSTPTCHYCSDVKDFLLDKGLEFEVLDVSKDLKARKDMMDRSGQLGVPVTIIEDEIVVGFNKEALNKAIKTYEKR